MKVFHLQNKNVFWVFCGIWWSKRDEAATEVKIDFKKEKKVCKQ